MCTPEIDGDLIVVVIRLTALLMCKRSKEKKKIDRVSAFSFLGATSGN